MSVLRVDAAVDGLATGASCVPDAVRALEPGAAVAVMIHGFRYMPGQPGHCPHESLFAPSPGFGRAAWPAALGLDGRSGLGVGFGWPARGHLGAAYRTAGRAGKALARLVTALREAGPNRRITLLGHSLGARVALSALPHLPAGAVDTLVLLTGAEFATAAAAAVASPAGRCVEVVNVVTRENLLFDTGFSLALSGGLRRTIGGGLDRAGPGWIDLPLHRPEVLDRLAALGYPVAGPDAKVSHWSAYTRAGALALWSGIISGRLPPSALRGVLPSRPRPGRRPPLPRLPRLPALPILRNSPS
ncbi:MAG: alpha/beta hydrolase [Gemmobacter sp.]